MSERAKMTELSNGKIKKIYNVFNRVVLVKWSSSTAEDCYSLLTFSKPDTTPERQPEQYITKKPKNVISFFLNTENEFCAVMHRGQYVVCERTRRDILSQDISEEEAKLWIKWTGVKPVRRKS